MTKVTRLKSGALLGEAGDNDSRAVVKLLQNCKTFDQMPSALELAECRLEYAAIILFPNGEMAQVIIDEIEPGKVYIGSAFKVNRGCTAVGSGADLAVGAMRSGKSAREAVAIACGEDPNSKLPVHTYELLIPPKKRKR